MTINIELPTGAPIRQNVTGLIPAVRDLTPIDGAANDVIEFARVPAGALIMEIGIFCDTALTNFAVGFEPIPGETLPAEDGDFFRVAAALTAGRTILPGVTANGGLPFLVSSARSLVFSSATAIAAAVDGHIWATYTMDGYTDNTDQVQLLSSA